MYDTCSAIEPQLRHLPPEGRPGTCPRCRGALTSPGCPRFPCPCCWGAGTVHVAGAGLSVPPARAPCEGAGSHARSVLAGIADRLAPTPRRPITPAGALAQIAARLRAPEGHDA